MLTSSQKFALQKEGYTARKKGIASLSDCPYEIRSDEWHYWQTGWLMRRYEEKETADDPVQDSIAA